MAQEELSGLLTFNTSSEKIAEIKEHGVQAKSGLPSIAHCLFLQILDYMHLFPLPLSDSFSDTAMTYLRH